MVALLGITGHGNSISPLASMIPAIMAKIAACGDPYLYAVTHPRFRAELDKIFCKSRGDGNLHTSNYSRGGTRNQDNIESECETVQLGPERKTQKGGLQRSESSCDDYSVSEIVETQH